MIAKGVVFTTDYEGNKYYIPYDKLGEWEGWCSLGEDNPESWSYPDWAVPIEGELFIVDILGEV